ncbi:hypothetical protein OA92_20795 [Marinomonas sp. SBI22]|uniref:DUF6508 domain-containing protein n=1 Tax=unclassified Marinomonas TaxID=196814 RepID=UPI0007AF59AA|nr:MULTISPECIES: DUF6508 domain-containing protein [unclassified Marinomonas]KZM39329.1 hypothetical protein OA92_20795 [Marinomonas sp. SBI22]KZM40124.1 hypothetical protein OA91_20065 [Marinomonas sp. SBI8L]
MNDLLELLQAADDEVANIKWEEHHPEYPDAINKLMTALGKSDLMFKDYRKHNFKGVIENINKADLEQLKCVITAILRSERWVTGSWKTHLEKGHLQSAIKQAINLKNENV